MGDAPTMECGSVLSDEVREWLVRYAAEPSRFAPIERGGVNHIPVKAHIVGDNACNGFYQTGDLLSMLCQLNEQFNREEPAARWHFYLYGEVDHICNTAYYSYENLNTGVQMANAHNTPNVLNLYFVERLAGYCGYYNGPAVVVAKSCAFPGNSLVAHEIGHYFSLPHTFTNVRGCAECVDGSNCRDCGDLFCDTPADYLSGLWNCPYGGTRQDTCGSGQPLVPDHTLFMGYAYQYWCRTRFSQEQQAAMLAYTASTRPYLLAHPEPETGPVGVTVLAEPAHMAQNVDHGGTVFRWNRAPNAERYLLRVSACNSTALAFEVVVTDTFHVRQLAPACTYVWRVKAFNAGNTCAALPSLFQFTTRSGTVGIGDRAEWGATRVVLANGHAEVHFDPPSTEGMEVALYSALGARVRTGRVAAGQGTHRMDLTGLPAGMYVLRLDGPGQVLSWKLVWD